MRLDYICFWLFALAIFLLSWDILEDIDDERKQKGVYKR